ncbi:MAG: hypothetical protein NTV06_06490 [candidate division Zixibacteria bacterium]|nr:hypothetical protein [candidate division Zixibacteria bacterium]
MTHNAAKIDDKFRGMAVMIIMKNLRSWFADRKSNRELARRLSSMEAPEVPEEVRRTWMDIPSVDAPVSTPGLVFKPWAIAVLIVVMLLLFPPKGGIDAFAEALTEATKPPVVPGISCSFFLGFSGYWMQFLAKEPAVSPTIKAISVIVALGFLVAYTLACVAFAIVQFKGGLKAYLRYMALMMLGAAVFLFFYGIVIAPLLSQMNPAVWWLSLVVGVMFAPMFVKLMFRCGSETGPCNPA